MASCDEDLKHDIIRKIQDFDVRGQTQYSEKYPKPFRTAAVLLPLKLCNGEVFILLTKRAKSLPTYASDAAFPGGMVDESDSSVIATALREAHEEVGLPPASVKILAVLSRGITKTAIVYPVVGLIPNDFQPIVNPSEVDFAFFIPLKDFLCEDKITKYHFKSGLFSILSRQLLYKEGDKEVQVWGFTCTFCIFLAKILLDKPDYLEIFEGCANTGRISDCFEEYFHLFYGWCLSEYSSKL